MTFRVHAVLSTGALLLLTSMPVRAENDPVGAEALFREARELLQEGKIDEACEKFEASAALEASSGTLLNLAACRLQQGRTATAWAYFVSAERSARAQNRPAHEREARQRAQELEPSLSYLTIHVTERHPGLRIESNGRRLEPGSFGSRVPMDPGKVVIEASAPGFVSYKHEVVMADAQEDRVVTIPKLELQTVTEVDEGPSTAPRATAPNRAADRASSPWPWIVGGAGAASLLAGGAFGVLALSSDSEAKRLCRHDTDDCPQPALDAESRRDSQAMLANIGVGVGLVGIGVAAVLFLTEPSDEARISGGWRANAHVSHDGAVVSVSSRF